MADNKEWTLMFYLGSDNALAPGIVSQLKSIKQAGFHQDVNVIAQFDPRVDNTPTHIFDVNIVDKIKSPKPWKIGFGPEDFAEAVDSSVPSLVTDKLWEEQANADLIKKSLGKLGVHYRPKKPSDCKKQGKSRDGDGEPSPQVSLTKFIEFCRENYPARHYMLFLLGHGLIVGNDMFLFDEHAQQHSLSLSNLGALLCDFKEKLPDDQHFEVLSFHSCSMSALEVAYELKDSANYMLASQGPAFVGSWPYRQILMRIFFDLANEEKDLETTLKSIFRECLDNSRDFQLAGYSFDLCLCDLRKVKEIRASLAQLASALSDGVKDPATQRRILLAHWDAQSYWQESYTDLGDLCFRLTERCKDLPDEGGVKAIRAACASVTQDLNRAVIKSEFAGPAYQYSHGLSVFYPWSMPENVKFWPTDYRNYKINKEAAEAKEDSWESFLTNYFDFTRRGPRGSELVLKGKGVEPARTPTIDENLLETIGSRGFSRDGQLAIDKGDPADRTDSPITTKGSPEDPTGGDSSGPSIKNYPPFTRPLPARRKGKSASRGQYS
jgi:hypothetical protein